MGAASDRVVLRPLAVGPRLQIYPHRNQDLARSRYVLVLENDLLDRLWARSNDQGTAKH